ncbi:MAG TPA: hypothetical protein VFX45_01060 [Solirubrobacterales bacterium]|nr:hypothetical protein [Solirubrobacterales bacterium]
MHRRRAIAGLCILCALVASAVATQGALAATNGTTAFTCKERKEAGGAGFSKAHCTGNDAVESGAKYEHVAVASDTTTEVALSNEATGGAPQTMTVKYTMSGVAITLKATGVTGAGWMKNAVSESGEHYAYGEAVITFTGVTTNLPGCQVYTDGPEGEKGEQGVLHTELLSISTQGQGDKLKISPKSGEVLAKFQLLGCNNAGLNGTDTFRGSIGGVPNGATVTFTHVKGTEEGTMIGTSITTGKAALEGALAIKAKDPEIAEDPYTPISPTTVAT